MSRRVRWLFRITLCLALGVVTTVGVAWGIACVEHNGRMSASANDKRGDVVWHVTCFRAFGIEVVESRRYRKWVHTHELTSPTPEEVVPTWSTLANPGGAFASRAESSELYSETAAGWPILALASMCEMIVGYDMHDPWAPDVHRPLRGIEFDVRPPLVRTSRQVVLPVRVLRAGFVINTLFFAVIWFALFFSARSLKRYNRTRRGLCPMCKYNLLGNPEGVTGCAECGWGREAFNAESPRARREECSSFEEQQA